MNFDIVFLYRTAGPDGVHKPLFGNDLAFRFRQDKQDIECPAGQTDTFARVENLPLANLEAEGAYGELGLHHSAMTPRTQRGKIKVLNQGA